MKRPSSNPSSPADFMGSTEQANKICFNFETKNWETNPVLVRLSLQPFDKGCQRFAFKLHELDDSGQVVTNECVAKFMDPNALLQNGVGPATRQMYFDDVITQLVAGRYADGFNTMGPPKKIKFLRAWILEFGQRQGSPIAVVEPFMRGKFKKHNNNMGGIFSQRNTPQAFTHFTWEASAHTKMVCDMQGVEDYYTDPQIHTVDQRKYGLGNMGMRGIQTFLQSHTCNPVCQLIGLPHLVNGTMVAPGTRDVTKPHRAQKQDLNPVSSYQQMQQQQQQQQQQQVVPNFEVQQQANSYQPNTQQQQQSQQAPQQYQYQPQQQPQQQQQQQQSAQGQQAVVVSSYKFKQQYSDIPSGNDSRSQFVMQQHQHQQHQQQDWRDMWLSRSETPPHTTSFQERDSHMYNWQYPQPLSSTMEEPSYAAGTNSHHVSQWGVWIEESPDQTKNNSQIPTQTEYVYDQSAQLQQWGSESYDHSSWQLQQQQEMPSYVDIPDVTVPVSSSSSSSSSNQVSVTNQRDRAASSGPKVLKLPVSVESASSSGVGDKIPCPHGCGRFFFKEQRLQKHIEESHSVEEASKQSASDKTSGFLDSIVNAVNRGIRSQ